MTTGARGTRVQGSCEGECAEVRLSLEYSRSNVGRKGSSRCFEEKVGSFARDGLALTTKRWIGVCEV